MSKGSEVIYGRGRLSRLLGVTLNGIRYLEKIGKIHPKKETLGDSEINMYTHQDVKKIKDHKWRI